MKLMSDRADSPPHRESRPEARQDFLDVARALAAGMVFLEHTRHDFLPAAADWPLSHFNVGFSGVVLFFIISGYIIPASLERGKPLGSFWIRRAFRLIPAFYFSIALAAALALISGPNPYLPALDDVRTWLSNLVLAPELFRRQYVCGVYWSLRLELIIYVAAAALAWTGWLRRAGGAAVIFPVAILAFGLSRPFIGNSPYDPNSPRIAVFMALFGLFAYRRHEEGLTKRWSPTLLVSGFLVAGSLVYLFNAWAFPAFNWRLGLCCFLTTWGIGLLPFCLLFAMRDRRMPAWACYLGRISYSTYLLHAFAWFLLMSLRGSVLFIPAVAALTVVMASFAYYFIELPGVHLGRIVEGWVYGKPRAVATTAPVVAPSAPTAISPPGVVTGQGPAGKSAA